LVSVWLHCGSHCFVQCITTTNDARLEDSTGATANAKDESTTTTTTTTEITRGTHMKSMDEMKADLPWEEIGGSAENLAEHIRLQQQRQQQQRQQQQPRSPTTAANGNDIQFRGYETLRKVLDPHLGPPASFEGGEYNEVVAAARAAAIRDAIDDTKLALKCAKPSIWTDRPIWVKNVTDRAAEAASHADLYQSLRLYMCVLRECFGNSDELLLRCMLTPTQVQLHLLFVCFWKLYLFSSISAL